MSGYRLDKQYLSINDMASITSALKGIRSLTDDPDIDGLLEKIGALMPDKSHLRDPSGGVHLQLAPNRQIREKLRTLNASLRESRIVSFGYVSEKGEETLRSIEPYSLFLRNYAWYLYGYCLIRSDFRIFRLTRIHSLESLHVRFNRRPLPEQDVARFEALRSDREPVRAVLRFKPSYRARAIDEFGGERIQMQPDGSLLVAADFTCMEHALYRTIGYGPNVSVIEPPSLIAEVRRYLAEMAAQYG